MNSERAPRTTRRNVLRKPSGRFVATVGAASLLINGCSVEPSPEQSDTVDCQGVSVKWDGRTATMQTHWYESAYGPGADELQYQYSNGTDILPLDPAVVTATTDPQTADVPVDATDILVTIYDKQHRISSCPGVDVPPLSQTP